MVNLILVVWCSWLDILTTDYYKQIQRLAVIIGENQGRKNNLIPTKPKQETVGNLITRYPYLYDHCLLSVDSSSEQQQTVYQVKNQLEKNLKRNYLNLLLIK